MRDQAFSFSISTICHLRVKMHEYLACGKPTIATGLPAIREFERVVSIAEGAEEWIQAIEDSLNDKDSGKEQRLRIARENSWQRRVEVFLKDVYKVLEISAS